MRRIFFTANADFDLDDIYFFISSQSYTNVPAEKVVQRIKDKVEFLAENPEAGTIREDHVPNKDIRFWPVFSYLVVYSFDEDLITVLRIIHGARDLPVHLNDSGPPPLSEGSDPDGPN